MRHSFDPFVPALALDADVVARLNWQPRYCPPPLECVASRRGDVLEVAFAFDGQRRLPPKPDRWRYRLEPTCDEHVVIARRIN